MVTVFHSVQTLDRRLSDPIRTTDHYLIIGIGPLRKVAKWPSSAAVTKVSEDQARHQAVSQRNQNLKVNTSPQLAYGSRSHLRQEN